MIMKKDTQKRSRLQRYGRLNTSHFLLLGAEGSLLIFVVLYGISNECACNWYLDQHELMAPVRRRPRFADQHAIQAAPDLDLM